MELLLRLQELEPLEAEALQRPVRDHSAEQLQVRHELLQPDRL